MPAARKRTTTRRSTSTRKRTSAPAKPVEAPPTLRPGERLWLLDVPYAERGIANANGARWHAGLRATIYTGRTLPHGLTPYASKPFSWERWLEDDLNTTPGPIPPAAHTLKPRPHQDEGAQAILRAAKIGARGFLLADEVGLGKAQPLDALVLTPTGFRPMGEIQVGDEVINPAGGTARVRAVFPQGERPVYRVTFADGSSVRADGEHLWPVNTTVRNSRGNDCLIKTTAEIADDVTIRNGGMKWYVKPMDVAPDLESGGDRPLDPYLLGVLLGDGHFKYRSTTFATADQEVVEAVSAVVPPGVAIVKSEARSYDYFIRRVAASGPNPVRTALSELGLAGHGSEGKFVPQAYKVAPVTVRLAVLQGLMDTDGSVTAEASHLEFASVSEALANDLAWLVRSLGGYARVTKRTTWFTVDGVRKTGKPAYRVSISAMPETYPPFRLGRKKNAYRNPTRRIHRRGIASIEPVGTEQTQCILLDSDNHLYVTDNFTVTHNTVTALEGVLALRSVRPVESLLIVTPLSVVEHWRRTVADLGLAQEGIRVVVINYDRLKKLLDVPVSAQAAKRTRTKNKRIAKDGTSLVDWDVVIADEAHKVRHTSAQRTQAFARIAGYAEPREEAPFVLWASATAATAPPETAFLGPIFAQATKSNGSALKDFGPWLQAQGFHVQHEPRFDKWTWTDDPRLRDQDINKMRAMLFDRKTPLAIRRLPTDISGWPEINRILLPVELDLEQRRMYEEAWTAFRREMRLAMRGGDPKASMVARLRFRQKASLIRVDGTVDQALDLLDNGHQVAISVQFIETLDAIKDALEKAKVRVAVMDGRDPSGREHQRLAFQRGDATVVLFTVEEGVSLHQNELLADGSHATNVPRSLLIHDVRLSAISTLQIEGRTHRDGQAANAWYCFAADTVEEQIAGRLLQKVISTKALVGDDTTTVRELEALLLPD